jgi:hypothetical protein
MKELMQTAEFIEVKNEYKILFSAVEQIQNRFDIFLMIDFTGKCIIVYHLNKLLKGFEKIKSASFYQKSISDETYNKNFGDKNRVTHSLSELIISRLELNNGNCQKN